MSTGFYKFDDFTRGLQKSDLIIIAGRPDMGKTTFALNIARFVAMECKIPVAFFSLDKSREELAFRLLSSEARIDAQRLRKGFLGETDWPKLTSAAERLSEAPLYIDDTPVISFLNMAARARRLKADGINLGLIVVDYIQLLQVGNREDKTLNICRALKVLAQKIEVPIIAISRLNCKPKDLSNHRPQMEDLQETDVFEQEADVIAFFHRDEAHNISDANPEKALTEIIIARHRNGLTGTVKLEFVEKFMHFKNPQYSDIIPPPR